VLTDHPENGGPKMNDGTRLSILATVTLLSGPNGHVCGHRPAPVRSVNGLAVPI
jgi:hypothetical protein